MSDELFSVRVFLKKKRKEKVSSFSSYDEGGRLMGG